MPAFGELLRLARHLRGMTQKKAAENLGIAQAIFSRLENGLIAPDDDIAAQAASIFNLPRDFFDITDTIYGPPVSVHTMLRGKKSEVSARDVDMITAELNLRIIHLRRFSENVDYSPTNELPVLDVEQYESVERIASTVRAHWKVVGGPIKNLTRLMEQAGVIIGESNFHGAAISGVTFSVPGQPPIVLVNRAHPADRLRFTLAHELGHLVMHRFPTAGMEDEANQFASSFLLPPNDMKGVFRGRKITLELLAALKMEWRVSMQALLMSAQSLNCLTNNQARYLWQQISARGWRLKEPAILEFPFDKPEVLPTIIKSHMEDLGFELSELIAIAKVSESDFREFYGPLKPDEPSGPHLRIVT